MPQQQHYCAASHNGVVLDMHAVSAAVEALEVSEGSEAPHV